MKRLFQFLLYVFVLPTVLEVSAKKEVAERSNGNFSRALTNVLSRQKRYLAFPDGSSVSAAICLTIGMIGNPDVDYISWAVNWGVAYNLPNHVWVKQHAHGFANLTKPMVQRRSRRSFYDEIQSAFDHMGFNGRACVARALCESAKYYMHAPGQKGNMLEELVRTVLSMPGTRVEGHEPQAHYHYDRIYRRSKRQTRDCHELYPGCQFSLLALALGKYVAAPAQLSKYNFM